MGQVCRSTSKGQTLHVTTLHHVTFLSLTSSLTKDVEKRPHYAELLEHPLIKKYEAESVDLGAWFQEQCRVHGNP